MCVIQDVLNFFTAEREKNIAPSTSLWSKKKEKKKDLILTRFYTKQLHTGKQMINPAYMIINPFIFLFFFLFIHLKFRDNNNDDGNQLSFMNDQYIFFLSLSPINSWKRIGFIIIIIIIFFFAFVRSYSFIWLINHSANQKKKI